MSQRIIPRASTAGGTRIAATVIRHLPTALCPLPSALCPQQYERRMQAPLGAADDDEPKAGFREILRTQVQRLMKTIKTAEPYEAFQILE